MATASSRSGSCSASATASLISALADDRPDLPYGDLPLVPCAQGRDTTAIFDPGVSGHAQSVRHVFYRMIDPRLPEPVEKDDKKGYRPVNDQLVKMRRQGIVPYFWLVDTTRRGYFTTAYNLHRKLSLTSLGSTGEAIGRRHRFISRCGAKVGRSRA